MDNEVNNFLLDKSDDELFKILENVISILNTTTDLVLKNENLIILNKLIAYKIKKISKLKELEKNYSKLNLAELNTFNETINDFDNIKYSIINLYNEINVKRTNNFN